MKKSLSFHVEIYGLIVVLLVVCAFLVRSFSIAAATGQQARQLTQAVALAQNAAERAFSGEAAPSTTQTAYYTAQGAEAAAADATALYTVTTAIGAPAQGTVPVTITVATADSAVYTLTLSKALCLQQ